MPERADDSPRWIVRRALKTALASALRAAGAPRAVASLRRRQAGGARVLVLSYHRVTDDFALSANEALPSLLVSAATLRRQLEEVARTHEVVSLADATRILSEPPGTARPDVAVVTFDDGYADNHEVALPVLAALRVPATVFVATGFTGTGRRLVHDRLHATLSALGRRGIPAGRAGLAGPAQAILSAWARRGPAATLDALIAGLPHPALVLVAEALEARTGLREEDLPPGSRLLDWNEIRALDGAGVDIGGHSVSHAVLSNLPLAEARREIAGCRDEIAERLGRPPRHFAYPNGYHTPAVRRAVAEAGFDATVTTEDGENARARGLHAIRRKVLWENSTLGMGGYSAALATCCFAGVFNALGLSRAVRGDRPDAPERASAASGEDDPERGRAGPGRNRDPSRRVAGPSSARELC
ncbi:MAG TPA: polysaccharide deacetylase family protein [Anaeromyxobacter sp.]